MAYGCLRDPWRGWRRLAASVRVKEPVSPVLEVTEIQTRVLAEGGPAVLFETVIGADGTAFGMPVLVNLFGTVERVARGMGREPAPLITWPLVVTQGPTADVIWAISTI